ncbi:unnamed protein product [Durusdinium trenchii]|uniref:Uncharacterized protein n=1 Tax=Durusdinium trenchii TaxID=1381693 RepID=A0ABP0R507_9DINO
MCSTACRTTACSEGDTRRQKGPYAELPKEALDASRGLDDSLVDDSLVDDSTASRAKQSRSFTAEPGEAMTSGLGPWMEQCEKNRWWAAVLEAMAALGSINVLAQENVLGEHLRKRWQLGVCEMSQAADLRR